MSEVTNYTEEEIDKLREQLLLNEKNKYYEVKFMCINCSYTGTEKVRKGTSVCHHVCPNCWTRPIDNE